MSQLFSSRRRPPGPGDRGGRPGILRRLSAIPLLGALIAAALMIAPTLAAADSASTLTVVGTSDVSDSGLMPNLLQPQFEKAFPAYTFKYSGTATLNAIKEAENGSVGASVLIVHAASLENQFVAAGYSKEQYGRAIFTNDFVLAGPKTDPAGIGTAGAHNIVQAFKDIATAGINGGGAPKVTLLSRGGGPGTVVEEHEIWALVAANSPPAGLLLCTVPASLGGGETPIAANNGVTANGQACPGGVLPSGSALPGWYAITNLTQGPNVVAANACTTFSASGLNSCYVLTDRGTYDYLASGTDPAGAIPSLAILTRQDDATAPGGANLLTNYFHAYIINPAATVLGGTTKEQVNLTAATDFVNFLTSPTVQGELPGYLAKTGDPEGPPFKPDASPIITGGFPHTYHAGKALKVTGTVTNAEPGYPAPVGKPVTIDEIEGGLPVAVASGNTKTGGAYSISFTPTSIGKYEITTAQIAQIELPSLSPVYGDLLSPAATAQASVTVQSAVTKLAAKSTGAAALVTGSIAPGTGHLKGSVTVMARHTGSHGSFRKVGTDKLAAGDGNFAVTVPLAVRGWQIKVKYQDPGQVLSSTSKTVKLTVGAKPGASVGVRSLKISGGTVKLTGSAKPAPATGGSKVELLALNTSAGAATRFNVVATGKLGVGKQKFSLHAKLKRGNRFVLVLEYLQKGQAPGFSQLHTVNVK